MGKASSALMVAAAVAAVLASGCGSNDDSSSAAGGNGGDTIKIGASLPLTGDFSEPGKAAKQGYDVWAAMVNERGGLIDGRRVALTIKDDASNQNTVVADYNALISKDKVDLLLGSFSSLLNLPASAVAERNQMLFVEPAGGAPDMFTRGFKFLFFTQQTGTDHQGDVWADWVLNLPPGQRPKTVAYPILDDPFASATASGIRAKLEAGGIRTVYNETYPADTKNFDAIASSMKAARPDAVVHGAGFVDGVGLTRAFLKADFRPDIFFQTTAPSLGEQYADGVGVGNTEGIMYGVSHSQEAKTPGNEKFVAKYKEMFGGDDVPEDAADAYAAGQTLEAAVKAVGSIAKEDQIKLADWLRSNSVSTILGTLKWDETGLPIGEFLVGQWQNGTREIVLPSEAATTEEIIPGWRPTGS